MDLPTRPYGFKLANLEVCQQPRAMVQDILTHAQEGGEGGREILHRYITIDYIPHVNPFIEMTCRVSQKPKLPALHSLLRAFLMCQ